MVLVDKNTGHLAFAAGRTAHASALGPQPNALMTLWSLGAQEGAAPLRYGDAVLLQVYTRCHLMLDYMCDRDLVIAHCAQVHRAQGDDYA
jgi:hypothetical protein